MSRTWLAVSLGLTALVAAVASACAPAPERTPTPAPGAPTVGEPKTGGTLRVIHKGSTDSVAVDPTGWDPHKAAALATHIALNMTQSKLFQFPQGPEYSDVDYTIMGDLVKSWEYTSPTRLVMRLQEGVRFHNRPPVNGRELVSEDIKFTFERLKKVATFAAYLYDDVQTIDTPDK